MKQETMNALAAYAAAIENGSAAMANAAAALVADLGAGPDYETAKAARAEFFALPAVAAMVDATARKAWSRLLQAAGITPLKKDGTAARTNAAGAKGAKGAAASKYAELVQWLRATASDLAKGGDNTPALVIGLLTDAMIENPRD